MSSITIPRKRYEKMMELLKENHELKEEIKELKFENEEYIWLGTSTHFGIENDKLKEENQELKEQIKKQSQILKPMSSIIEIQKSKLDELTIGMTKVLDTECELSEEICYLKKDNQKIDELKDELIKVKIDFENLKKKHWKMIMGYTKNQSKLNQKPSLRLT